MKVVAETNLPLKIFKRGKVRDIYEVDNNLLIVASDRISAFDFVLHEPVPKKGIFLTQISKFWFDYFKDFIDNHLISTDISDFPDELKQFESILFGRSMLVRKAEVFPIECVVRGYLSGSAWESYKKNGKVCGIDLPKGLKESEKFEEPLFTPSTKAEKGHDINISFDEMKKIIGKDEAELLRDLSIEIYKRGADYAYKKGIIVADTKFEFGKIGDEVIVVDELLTPDSSRFWPVDSYKPGKPQPSFDKQYVRDYLISTGWDRNSAPPHLPKEVIEETGRKYQEAYERLTGKKFLF